MAYRRSLTVFAVAVVLMSMGPAGSRACDTWVAMGDQTTCGYTIHAKNSDRPIFGCQPLVYNAARRWPVGAQIDLVRTKIPQVRQTYATLGSSPYWSWGYEEGINEYSVAIGNEAIWTKVLAEDAAAHKAGKGPKFGPNGMDLVRLGLERGKTARQSLDAIARVVEVHGQFGSASPTRGISGGYHNSFIIADPTEAWILETAGHHWVAKRIKKGATSISNGVSLGTDIDLKSDSVVSHAVAKGWWPADKTAEFHFQHAYSPRIKKDDPVRTRVHGRAACSRKMLAQKPGKVDVRWMMNIARCRQIGLNITASSAVAVLPHTDAELPVYWWCPSTPIASCYVPFFVHGSGLPKIVSSAGTCGSAVEMPSKTKRDTFSSKSYWWLVRDLADKVRADSKTRGPIVRKAFDALEKEFQAGLGQPVRTAAKLRSSGKPEAAAAILDAYSNGCLDKVIAELNVLRRRFSDQAETTESDKGFRDVVGPKQ
ncbi:MAG: C69 family dipeptidase [Phycisphaerae bacterium]|jgi:secernin|nr:C69 family dipeptidase [Phycisphaerae bacterium]MDP7289903.1 C69 family dipeptidase [Phycisphaerae bacterium]